MNKLLLFCTITALCGFTSCKSGTEIIVNNPGLYEFTGMVELNTDSLQQLSANMSYIVKDNQGIIIPSQLTYDGKLIFQTSLKPSESKSYNICLGIAEKYPTLTYGRNVKERHDDFAWENDRVAFRMYGQPLIAVEGPSNGLDIWYKRTNDLIIDKWYKSELQNGVSYHEDHGEGMDAYNVGRTLGAGAMAPFINNTLILNENFVRCEILENGPLRTTFRLIYKDLLIDSVTVNETRTFSIDAGSQMTRITQEYGVIKEMTVAAGIVKRPESTHDAAMAARTESGVAAIIYQEPETPQTGKVFIGLVFPSGIEKDISNTYTFFHPKKQILETHSHVLGVTTYHPGCPITYYAGYGWEKAGFSTLGDFQNYIGIFSKNIEEPLIIKYL